MLKYGSNRLWIIVIMIDAGEPNGLLFWRNKELLEDGILRKELKDKNMARVDRMAAKSKLTMATVRSTFFSSRSIVCWNLFG